MRQATLPVCMIVEDEALIGMMLEDDFTRAGYEVVGPFATCAAALEWLKDGKPNVAVLDSSLKDGPSTEVARTLRARGIPFFIHSGRDETLESDPVFEATPRVSKPATQSAVVEAARKLMSR